MSAAEALGNPSFTCTWEEFKQHAAEFFRNVDNVTYEQADHGFKMLSIFWFNLDARPHQLHQAQLLIDMASKEVLDKMLQEPELVPIQ